MNIRESLSNKNILITGASSGIGKVIAMYLSTMGANVILVARREEELKALVDKLPNKAWYYTYDLSNLEEIETIFKYIKEQDIKLDGLVIRLVY